jgi:glycosyltransferase involved in cell wall biosynthesis
MERQLVSIVICNFNHGRYLRQAIDSALAQTYSPIEVIVVDDGSTDNSRETIATYGNRIVPVLKENGGLISATNAGYSHSRGEVICFLDSDDVYLPHRVERTVAVLNTYPNVDWVRSKDKYVDQNLQPVGTENPSGSSHLVPPNPYFYLEKIPTVSYQLPTMRRTVASEIFPMPSPPTRGNADAVCCALMGTLERPVYGYFLDEVLQLYRVHEAQDSGFASVVDSLREAVIVGRLISSIWSRRMGVQRTAAHVYINSLIVSTLEGQSLWGSKRWGDFTRGLGQVAILFSSSPGLALRQMLRLLAAFLAPKLWLIRWRGRVGAYHLWSKRNER